MSIIIRKGVAEDIPNLLDLGKEFFDMTDLGEITEYCEDSTWDLLNVLIVHAESALLVAEKDGQIVGMVGVSINPFYFNRAHRVAQELFWFVSEEHRGMKTALKLLEALDEWAKEVGANSISMAALGCNFDGVDKFYRAKGFIRQETHYLRRV